MLPNRSEASCLRALSAGALRVGADGIIRAVSVDHASQRVRDLDLRTGRLVHEAMHPECSGEPCALRTGLEDAWAAHRGGRTVDWEAALTPRPGVLHFRLQNALDSAGGLFREELRDYAEESVLIMLDVTDLPRDGRSRWTDTLGGAGREVTRGALRVGRLPEECAVCGAGAIVDDTLGMLYRRLILAHEQERARIAAEIHDGLGQILGLTRQQIELTLERFQLGDPRAGHMLERALDNTRLSLIELRRLVGNLRILPTNARDLMDSARRLCTELRASSPGIEIMDRVDLPPSLKPEVAGAAYRILQESVSNAIRHSAGNRIDVLLAVQAGELRLTVQDNGKGFDPMALNRDDGCFGLDDMWDRIAASGGELEIETEAGAGTRVSATWSRDSAR